MSTGNSCMMNEVFIPDCIVATVYIAGFRSNWKRNKIVSFLFLRRVGRKLDSKVTFLGHRNARWEYAFQNKLFLEMWEAIPIENMTITKNYCVCVINNSLCSSLTLFSNKLQWEWKDSSIFNMNKIDSCKYCVIRYW